MRSEEYLVSGHESVNDDCNVAGEAVRRVKASNGNEISGFSSSFASRHYTLISVIIGSINGAVDERARTPSISLASKCSRVNVLGKSSHRYRCFRCGGYRGRIVHWMTEFDQGICRVYATPIELGLSPFVSTGGIMKKSVHRVSGRTITMEVRPNLCVGTGTSGTLKEGAAFL